MNWAESKEKGERLFKTLSSKAAGEVKAGGVPSRVR